MTFPLHAITESCIYVTDNAHKSSGGLVIVKGFITNICFLRTSLGPMHTALCVCEHSSQRHLTIAHVLWTNRTPGALVLTIIPVVIQNFQVYSNRQSKFYIRNWSDQKEFHAKTMLGTQGCVVELG